MAYLDINSDFDVAVAKERHRVLSAQIPNELGINRSFLNWAVAWDGLIHQPPDRFYNTLSRNIPGMVTAFIDFMGTQDGELTVSVKRNQRFVFEAENVITTDCTGKTLRFKEWVVKDIDSRRQGIGLNLFMNLFEFAVASGFDRITLRAGKEDGKFFWADHGFYLKDDYHKGILFDNILRNMAQCFDTIPVGILKYVYSILSEGALDVSWKIVRLPGMVADKPLGWWLMQGDNPEYVLNLHDPEQVVRAKQSFERSMAIYPVPAVS